jgi:hypothetical protein
MLHAYVQRFDMTGDRVNILGSERGSADVVSVENDATGEVHICHSLHLLMITCHHGRNAVARVSCSTARGHDGSVRN